MEYISMRLGELGRHLAEDVDAFGFEPRQVRQPRPRRRYGGRAGTGFRGCNWLYLGVHRDLSASVKSRPIGPA